MTKHINEEKNKSLENNDEDNERNINDTPKSLPQLNSMEKADKSNINLEVEDKFSSMSNSDKDDIIIPNQQLLSLNSVKETHSSNSSILKENIIIESDDNFSVKSGQRSDSLNRQNIKKENDSIRSSFESEQRQINNRLSTNEIDDSIKKDVNEELINSKQSISNTDEFANSENESINKNNEDIKMIKKTNSHSKNLGKKSLINMLTELMSNENTSNTLKHNEMQELNTPVIATNTVTMTSSTSTTSNIIKENNIKNETKSVKGKETLNKKDSNKRSFLNISKEFFGNHRESIIHHGKKGLITIKSNPKKEIEIEQANNQKNNNNSNNENASETIHDKLNFSKNSQDDINQIEKTNLDSKKSNRQITEANISEKLEALKRNSNTNSNASSVVNSKVNTNANSNSNSYANSKVNSNSNSNANSNHSSLSRSRGRTYSQNSHDSKTNTKEIECASPEEVKRIINEKKKKQLEYMKKMANELSLDQLKIEQNPISFTISKPQIINNEEDIEEEMKQLELEQQQLLNINNK